MNKSYFKDHIDRVRTAIDPSLAASTVAEWLVKYTMLAGKKFSFKDHEYQEVLLNDEAPIKFVKKCSQIGISELSVRRVTGKTNLHAGINAMYVLPTASFCSMFSATRLASVLDSSKKARESLYRTNSTTVKRFFNDSFIYMRGASRSGQAISVPVHDLTIDEVDFAEDQDVLTSFTSRMTHADPLVYGEWWFSTPTVGNYGVSYLYDNSKQFVELQRCCHCNHEFHADYYKNVKLPGFNVPDGRLKGPAGQLGRNTTYPRRI